MPVRVDALFEHGGDHRAEIALFGEHQPDRGLLGQHPRRIAPVAQRIAIAARRANGAFGNKIVPPDSRTPLPLLGGPLARRTRRRRAKRVGQEVGGGGSCGHFGRIYPK
jgi:hypothetical protein